VGNADVLLNRAETPIASARELLLERREARRDDAVHKKAVLES
jgi:hypothetical protein